MIDGPPGAKTRFLRNAFFILGLAPTTTATEVEREGARLLAQLQLGVESVATYETPVGRGQRDAELVRWALGELRDPGKRMVHELWAGMRVD